MAASINSVVKVWARGFAKSIDPTKNKRFQNKTNWIHFETSQARSRASPEKYSQPARSKFEAFFQASSSRVRAGAFPNLNGSLYFCKPAGSNPIWKFMRKSGLVQSSFLSEQKKKDLSAPKQRHIHNFRGCIPDRNPTKQNRCGTVLEFWAEPGPEGPGSLPFLQYFDHRVVKHFL